MLYALFMTNMSLFQQIKPPIIVSSYVKHKSQCLTKELGINGTTGNHSYSFTSITKDTVLQNHKSVFRSCWYWHQRKRRNLTSLYWIPKHHKTPYKERYIARSSRCSTKHLSKVLTPILSTVKYGLQKYGDDIYSISGVNQMWILNISSTVGVNQMWILTILNIYC